jgi:ATP-dependent RNA circularization protein (DNA/RNA ligase family)
VTDFLRFPHTPHLAWLGKGEPRDDKVLAPAEAAVFLAHAVVLEEKIDGANLGLSVDGNGVIHAQNRGQYLQRPFTGQFARLNEWLAMREDVLFGAVSDSESESLILFGEWVAAVHSFEYTHLPDYFLLFDVYDRSERRFWSSTRRDALAARCGLSVIHEIGRGRYGLPELRWMINSGKSLYREGGFEGIYLRQEDDDWLIARAKLVHPDFVQSIGDHWRSRALRWNKLMAKAVLPVGTNETG